MEKFGWKWTIEMNITLLKLLGMWPSKTSTYQLNSYTLYTAFSTLLITFGYNVYAVINIFFALEDLQRFTDTMFVTLTIIMSGVKAFFYFKNMRTLRSLLRSTVRKFSHPSTDHHKKVIRSGMATWATLSRMIWCSTMTATTLNTSRPLLDGSYARYRLPFHSWFPVDFKRSPHYQLVFGYQAVCVGFITIVIMAVDTVICLLNAIIGTECDLVCHDLRSIQQDEIPDDMNRKLVKCIRYHKEIVSFATKSNRFFDWIVFWQFFTSAVSMGISMFLITLIEPFSGEFFSLVVYGGAVVAQVLSYCWFGNEVEIKSDKISFAAYESDWISAPLKFKKNLLTFMTRSQVPIKVSALNLFFLSLETFKKILKTSYSYFAVLKG